jgi:peptide/nickel transport system permease protein
MSHQLMFILRRVLITIPVLFVMSIVVFMIIRLVPGDPVRTMLGFRATDANVLEVRHQLGLDRGLFAQYVSWIGKLAHGDLGTDFVSHAPLSELLLQRLPVTFELTGLAMLLAVLTGAPLGVRAAIGGHWIGRPFATDPVGNLRHIILPVLTLATGEAAYILRTTRGAVTAVLDRPFVTFLRAKGISPRRIVFGHVLRNAGPTIVTVTGIQVGVLLGGAIIIETLFALPGVGRLVVTGITQRNYPTVQAGVLAVATIYIVVSLVTDLIVGWLDPRVADGTMR